MSGMANQRLSHCATCTQVTAAKVLIFYVGTAGSSVSLSLYLTFDQTK